MDNEQTPDFSEAVKDMQEVKESMGRAMQVIVHHFNEKVFPAVHNAYQQVMPVVQRCYTAIYESYRNAGMPYGDTHEGFTRWMDDMKQIRDHQHEIEAILQQHQHLIDMRNFGEKIRAKREQQQE